MGNSSATASPRRQALRITGLAAPGEGLKGKAAQAYFAALGLWRQTDRTLLSQTLLVSGSPRSGTTWLDEALAYSLDRVRVEEPTNARKVAHWRPGLHLDGRPYRDPDESDPVLADALERLITGTYLGPRITPRRKNDARRLWARQPIVTKVVTFNMLLPWLVTNLPELAVTEMVRNPLSVISSQLSAPGTYWNDVTELSRPYQRLFEAQPHLANPLTYEHPEEALATMWACEHRWLADNRDRLDRVVWVRYEELVADTEKEIRRICEAFGFDLPAVLPDSVLRRPSRSVKEGSAAFAHGDGVSGYRAKMSAEQIDRAKAVLERYDWPFYGADEV